MPLRAIVTDIEGTTSSIAFVKDVLFPYAARAIPHYLREHRDDNAVRDILDAVSAEAQLPRADVDALSAQLLAWIDADHKFTPLKTLQGLVWRAGYESGAYRAHIYADAAAQLQAWHARGIPLYVYSSGSIAAQKLFFAHSEAGDLTPLFRGYFDTTTGPKRDSASYRRIADDIGAPPAQILFLSDIGAELDAAAAAGLRTCWLQRPQDHTAADRGGEHPRARSFADIDIDQWMQS
jgi:enolase-phosphatase E1